MKIGSTDIVNCKIGSTQVNEVRIGSTLVWQFSSVDPDAQAFITAAGITNPTQQTAINTLVVSLKANGIWTKMKAIYPFVGGTATSHKFNLKNPLDTNAAFRLSFVGGWTHSANGALPNGVNGWANTFYNQTTVGDSLNSAHLSYYSRTNSNGTEVEIGCESPGTNYNLLEIRTLGNTYFLQNQNGFTTVLDGNSIGFYIGNRQASNDIDGWKNGIKIINATTSSTLLPNRNIYIGALHQNSGNAMFFTTKQCAFSSIGDGLTDTEASNLYTAVQAFQTSLGRSIGPQTVSDADAQAFVTAANIQDQVQADAVNNLVIGLKADGLWTKMKAIYPMVGGTNAQHAWNLKNTAQYQITWYGGVTSSSNGVTGNGTNGYGDTFLNNNVMGSDNVHISIYTPAIATVFGSVIGSWDNLFGSTIYSKVNPLTTINTHGSNVNFSPFNPGFILVKRPNSTQILIQKNNSITTHSLSFNSYITTSFKLLRTGNYNGEYTNENLRFASIGDTLTDIESSNLYTRVQAFQTTLGRQV